MEMDALEPLGDGEYYNFEIEGCEIYETNGLHVGTVKAVETYTANDILTVSTRTAKY